MILTIWLLILIGGLTVLYVWLKYQFSYWKRKNVAYVEPFPIFGNLRGLFTMTSSPAEQFTELYNHEHTKNHAAFGIYIFNRPALVIRDLAMAKTIFIKEFNKFANHYASADPHGDPLAFNSLFFIKAPQWKEMRAKVTPVFTTGKMKQMFPLIDEIGCQLNEYLCRLTKDTKTCVREVKEVSALFSTDVIASVAYGICANSLKDPNSDFRRNGAPIFECTTYRAFEFVVIFFLPHLVKLFGAKLFSKKASKFLRESINFAMENRAKTGISRNDLIDILLKFKESSEAEGESVDTDMLVGQAAIFFTAGFETSSSIVSFGLHELSRKPDLQKRLREELKDSLINNDGKITYESLNEMEYLEMVIKELLRLYPPQPFLDRECTLDKDEKDFSLKPHIDFNIPNGMPVYYPVFAIQRDPKYFPNPDEFDPERFSPDNKQNIAPFSYMPFGVGPRACIGERLGVIQSKMGLVNFLRNHYIEPCEKSHKKMQLDSRGLLLSAKGGIYVKLVRDPLFIQE